MNAETTPINDISHIWMRVNRRWLATGALSGILAGLVVFSMLVFLSTRMARAHKLEKELAHATEELNKYQAIVDQVTQLEQTRNQLRARRDVIHQLYRSDELSNGSGSTEPSVNWMVVSCSVIAVSPRE